MKHLLLSILFSLVCPIFAFGQNSFEVFDGNGKGAYRDSINPRNELLLQHVNSGILSTKEGYKLQQDLKLNAPDFKKRFENNTLSAQTPTDYSFADSLKHYNPEKDIPKQNYYPEQTHLIWQRNIFANDFSQQGQIASWYDGHLDGFSVYQTMPLLGSVRTGGALVTQNFGERWQVTAGMQLMKYNEPWQVYNTFGGNASVAYTINDNMSLNAFANYQSAPFMSNIHGGGLIVYGGYMTFKTNNDKWGVDVGAQNIHDPVSGKHAIVPIIKPYYNLNGAKLGIDFGGLLYEVFRNISLNVNGGGSNDYNGGYGNVIVAPHYRPPSVSTPHQRGRVVK